MQSQKSSFSVLPWLEGLIYQNNNPRSVPLEKKGFIQVGREMQSCWGEEEQTLFLIRDLKVIALSFFDYPLGIFAILYHFSVLIGVQVLSKSHHILLWEFKTTIVKRFYFSYLWIFKRKKMVYIIKLLVVSSKTLPTFHIVFLPRPLNVDTASQSEVAYQNGNTLHISSPKQCIFMYW